MQLIGDKGDRVINESPDFQEDHSTIKDPNNAKLVSFIHYLVLAKWPFKNRPFLAEKKSCITVRPDWAIGYRFGLLLT